MQAIIYDFLKWAQDKEILPIINKEILYYSNKITKVNHFGINQERILLLTDEALYNFQKKKSKRRIKYDQIIGITISNKQNDEFVIHGMDDEYDYHYHSSQRNLIICLIAKFYEEQKGQNLKICEVPDKTLKNYVTGKKEKKKDKNFSKMDESKKIDTKEFIKINEDSNKNIRSSSMSLDDEVKTKIEDEFPKKIKTLIRFCKNDNLSSAKLEDFKVIKIIGRGTLGKVYLVQFKNTNQYYTMKSIAMDYLKNPYEIINSLCDKKIVQNLNYPFLVGVGLCFETEERLYFIMNLIKGKSLYSYIKEKNIEKEKLNKDKERELLSKNMEEDQVKFYAAIIGLTLDYLHKMGIEYRDIRPDDIIIDEDGYLKIVDFKISKLLELKEGCLNIKETSEYLAPEIINRNEYKPAADWWTYGIIIYELLFGVPPFYNEKDSKIKEQIVKLDVRFPKISSVSSSVKDLIKKLLNKNPSNRIGHSKGFDEIKKHDFFKGFNFDNLINKKITAKYKPTNIDIIKNKEPNIEVSYDDLINSKILIK